MAKCEICGQKVILKKVMVKGFKYVCFDCVKAAGNNPFLWLDNMRTTVPELRERIVKLHPERAELLLSDPIPPSKPKPKVRKFADCFGLIPYCGICGQICKSNRVMLKGFDYVCHDCVRAGGHSPYFWLGNLFTTVPELKEQIIKLHPERAESMPSNPYPPIEDGQQSDYIGNWIRNMRETNRQKSKEGGLGKLFLVILLFLPFGILSELVKDKKR